MWHLVLLAVWWIVVAVMVGGIILLCLTILSGVAIAIGVGLSSLWVSARDGHLQKHVPRWAEFLDDL